MPNNGANPVRVKIDPVESEISKIQVWHSDCIRGYKFFDKQSKVVLESGYFTDSMTEVALEEGERLVQVKSKHYDNSGDKNYHCNLVLVFAKLE